LSAGNNKSLETPRDAVSVADSDGDDDGDDDAVAISVRSTDCGPRTSREVDARMRMPWDVGNPIPIPYPCYAPLDGLSSSVSVRRVPPAHFSATP